MSIIEAPATASAGTGAAPGSTGSVSVVVPTRNESGNVVELLGRLRQLPAGLVREVVFVDDSDDATPAVIQQAASDGPLSVRIVHRGPGARLGGLSGAVIEGLRIAAGEWVCVMDGDLQHPPEVIARLVEAGVRDNSDIVCATRNIAGGDRDGLSGVRDVLSKLSTLAARSLFPGRLRGVSDPMSGFFMVRREAVEIERLRPTGFKILLEILVRTPGLRRVEVPFEFGTRFAGDSKASLREAVKYLHHLARLRFGLESDRRRTRPAAENRRPAGRHRVLPYRYDIGGYATIASDVELRELGWFRSDQVEEADIEIRRGLVGRRLPQRRITVDVAAGDVLYQEHLGALATNFSVDMSGPIRITVSPLLAASPHVVYTNVVEALLRFVLVSRGSMLLHSAAFMVDGRTVMLSAKTDTGKTGTILRIMRERQGTFLSDDMTIVGADGSVHCYPKPLTISAHTLRAVNSAALSYRERLKLAVQSRIHSKSGRSMGCTLASLNLPIMALNALTQIIVPPPKYMVTRLVDCPIGSTAKVSDLFIIERGEPCLAEVSHDEALEELIANTDDAYGFPPFSQFAPAIALDGDGYLTLRAKEQAILASALQHIRVRRLASDNFSWADTIPQLLAGDAGTRQYEAVC